MRCAFSATGRERQAGPGVTPEAHSHHGASSEGNKCVACHMPQIAADHCRRQGTEPHVQLHLALDDGQVRHPESLHVLPQGQDHALGARRAQSVVKRLTVEDGRPVTRPRHVEESCMNLVPDWAPNIHPLLVHFPIALLQRRRGRRCRRLGVSAQQDAPPSSHALVRARHGRRHRGVCDRPRGLADHLVPGNGAGGPRGALELGVAHGLVLRDFHDGSLAVRYRSGRRNATV